MHYHVEQRIHTLSQLAIDGEQTSTFGFAVEDVTFSDWQIKEGEGYWTHDYWLAGADLDAPNYIEAWRQFIQKLVRIVPRMTLISQCYMEHLAQPVLIKRTDMDVAFIWWVLDHSPVPLMFMDKERTALDQLLAHSDLPKEFFYYWRDAVNTFGYSSKLLLMLSAVEALTGVTYAMRKEKEKKKLYYERLEQILGPGLKKVFWGTEKEHNDALRHRLSHGEYFDPKDNTHIDYVGEVHRSVIRYFNEHIFKDNLLDEAIVKPQRHLLGNADLARSFIRSKGDAELCLKDVLADAAEHDIGNLAGYDTLLFDDFDGTY